MSLEEELDAFYSEKIDAVVENNLAFREKLNIGSDAFRYLSKAEALSSFISTTATGAGAASLAFAGWSASLSTLAQLGVAIGFVSTPIGWITAAGIGGATAAVVGRTIHKSLKAEAITEIPNFLNSPIDVLAASICNLIFPVLVKIAHADGIHCENEGKKIREYFTLEWGINSRYIDNLYSLCKQHLSDFRWEVLRQDLAELAKSGDFKLSVISLEICRIAEEVALADGAISDPERLALNELKQALHFKAEKNAVLKDLYTSTRTVLSTRKLSNRGDPNA